MSTRRTVWGTLPDTGTVLTTAEYLQTAESVRVQELTYGTLNVAESPSPLHQQLLLELAVALRAHVRDHDLGRVWIAPLDVILDPARALVLQPDLFYVSKARADIVSDRVWGAPDMVLEVLSPNPRIGDLDQRLRWFAEYGVRECWLVHQLTGRIEIVQMGERRVMGRRVFDAATPIESTVFAACHLRPMTLEGWADAG